MQIKAAEGDSDTKERPRKKARQSSIKRYMNMNGIDGMRKRKRDQAAEIARFSIERVPGDMSATAGVFAPAACGSSPRLAASCVLWVELGCVCE